MQQTLMTAFLIGIYVSLAMREEDVNPGALVKFHFSDKSRRKQKNESLIRRAEALDGQIAVIMNRPFYFDKTRTRIQSLGDPDLTLAVKLKHLEFIRPPPPKEEQIDIGELPPLESSADELTDEVMTLSVHRPAFGDIANDQQEGFVEPDRSTKHETQIDLFVERRTFAEKLKDHQLSFDYLMKELSIADDEQYSAVLVCHPNTTLQIASNNRRVNSNLHRPHLGLQLLRNMGQVLAKSDSDCSLLMTSKNTAQQMSTAKNLLSQCMWDIFEWQHCESAQHYATPSFFEALQLADSRKTIFTALFIKSLRQHFRNIIAQQRPLVIQKHLDNEAVFKFVRYLTWTYLRAMYDYFTVRYYQLKPLLSESVLQFYCIQFEILKKTCTGKNSDLDCVYGDLITPIMGNARATDQFIQNRKQIISRFQEIAAQIPTIATRLNYYLSAGKFLVTLRDAENAKGKIALICDQEFLTSEWLRIIPNIINQSNSCISVRRF